MKHTLIITPSHLLLVSDSLPELGDIALETLITGEKEMFAIDHLEDIDENTQVKILGSIPQIDSLPILDVTSIEEELQKRGWVDTKKLARDYCEGSGMSSRERYLSYLKGFNDSLSLNKERIYTEADLKTLVMKAYCIGKKDFANGNPAHNLEETALNIIQSLSKNQMEVEIEMERIIKTGNIFDGNSYKIGNILTGKFQPKITNNTIKILRIK